MIKFEEGIKFEDMVNKVIWGDCLEVMKIFADKSFDLVLTDPPYGLEWSPTTLFGKNTPQTKALKDLQEWDRRPDKNYFNEIQRVGKEWVIWGGNYFADYLGVCKEPWLWDKKTGNNNYADGELAFTSRRGTLRIFHHQWCGAFKDSERGIRNVHPTQKPIELMKWCLIKFPEAQTILDPFMGSGTTLIAAKYLHRNAVGIEISEKYCEIARRRLEQQFLF